ncbi:Scr1 family TA system antitoxin-like transcriptional regulator [Solwaraspora sp. WMMD406]|uniref:Scr1 family TA system antitoxin-like transcriptional regulator n=1 Tax=Solwaraspora sp. WMMD406 TaxID=3016095 RepID=UPI002417805A|nr:Scr1 family TA system antitoxin-like transcriptional regulator [Solwaraspora sp. WMMD406]MDG4766531.1 Scr1 family TA system antitoxin-like transcriptional regulator [Solwaraspora sp. WMMD406]
MTGREHGRRAGGTALLRRQLGRWLTVLRNQAGLSQDAAANRLGRGSSTIWRIEAGDERTRWNEADVTAMCQLYRADDRTRERILALAAETGRSSEGRWWHDQTDGLPVAADPYPVFEQSATVVRHYAQEAIPDLLQAPEYAEAVLRRPAGLRSDDEIAARLDQLAARHRHLLTHPHPPAVQVIVNEGALRRTAAGDAATTRAQLDHAGTGLVRLTTVTGTMYLDRPAHVTAYERVWSDLAGRAVDDRTGRAVDERLGRRADQPVRAVSS